MLNRVLSTITQNKRGVEIGGPSPTGTVIYQTADSMDNVILVPTQFGPITLPEFITTIKTNKDE